MTCTAPRVRTFGQLPMVELEQAREDGQLVRVHRRKHLAPVEGFVLAMGERWLLLAKPR